MTIKAKLQYFVSYLEIIEQNGPHPTLETFLSLQLIWQNWRLVALVFWWAVEVRGKRLRFNRLNMMHVWSEYNPLDNHLAIKNILDF